MNKITCIMATLVAAMSVACAQEEQKQNWELTLGGGGQSINGEASSVGVDVGLSTNPFKTLPDLWVGAVQGLYWEPALSGSTDINSNWNFHIYKNLYLNTGWSVGALYSGGHLDTWRTGPQATFEYYIGENAFVYAGVDYDLWLSNSDAENGFRWSFGLGITW